MTCKPWSIHRPRLQSGSHGGCDRENWTLVKYHKSWKVSRIKTWNILDQQFSTFWGLHIRNLAYQTFTLYFIRATTLWLQSSNRNSFVSGSHNNMRDSVLGKLRITVVDPKVEQIVACRGRYGWETHDKLCFEIQMPQFGLWLLGPTWSEVCDLLPESTFSTPIGFHALCW